jgi:MFS family permease
MTPTLPTRRRRLFWDAFWAWIKGGLAAGAALGTAVGLIGIAAPPILLLTIPVGVIGGLIVGLLTGIVDGLVLGTVSALGWLGNPESSHRVRAAVIAAVATICGGDLAFSVLAGALSGRLIAPPIVRNQFFQVILIVAAAVAAGLSRRLPPEGSPRTRERRRLTPRQRARRRFWDNVDRWAISGLSVGLGGGVCAGLIGYVVAGFAEAALFDLVQYGAAGALAGFTIGAVAGCARARALVHGPDALRARR